MHPRGYVELHLHTAFSLLDGASLPEEIVPKRKQMMGYYRVGRPAH
jgi:DNA polymerase III alpha subunit